jgi:activator of 2-hydroxyglutaryl-CoA dehydratase
MLYIRIETFFSKLRILTISKKKDVIFPTYQVALGILDLKEWKTHSKQKQIEDKQKIEQLGKYFKNRSLHIKSFKSSNQNKSPNSNI